MLEENAGQTFNPATPATFTIVPEVVTVPYSNGSGYVTAINELGENLILGTATENIYFWDKKSTAFTTTYKLPEKNTSTIQVGQGVAYIFAGRQGNCYIGNLQSSIKLFQIPEQLFKNYYSLATASNANTSYIQYTDSAILHDELLFPVEVDGYGYLMSYNIQTKALIRKGISSYGSDLSTTDVPGRIYKLIIGTNLYNNLMISTAYRNGSSYQYSIESWLYQYLPSTGSIFNEVYDNYEAYIVTNLFAYGEPNAKKTLRNIQISLTRPLSEGQGIKIYYRRDDDSDWILSKTFDYTTLGAIKDVEEQASITDIIDLQIKIELNGYNDGTTFGTSPRLKLIRLIP